MSASIEPRLTNEDFQAVAARLAQLPVTARKLLCVIIRQAYRGVLQSKEPGVATMPEVHEACGLDVDAMYGVLSVLRKAGWIELTGQYPFEEIRLRGKQEQAIFERCEADKILLEDWMVDLRPGMLKA